MSIDIAIAKDSTPSFMAGSTNSLFQSYFNDYAFAHNFTNAVSSEYSLIPALIVYIS